MADRNTTGAVHLASIDLDISGFHKNIEEIKKQIDEVSKYVNDTKFQFGGTDSTGNKQNTGVGESIAKELEKATQSVQEFGQTLSTVTSKNKDLDTLVNSLKLSGTAEDIQLAKDRLESLFEQIGDFKKIDVQTKEGELFRAVVTSSDDAGHSIRKVIDLTEEFSDLYLSTKVTEKGNQNVESIKREAISVEELTQKYKALEISTSALSSVISGSRIESPAIKDLAIQSENLAQQVKNASNSIQKSNVSVKEMDEIYSNLLRTFNTVSKLWGQITKDANESGKSFNTLSNNIEKIILKLSNLGKLSPTSKISKQAVQLKSEFNNLYKEIQNGTISVEAAKVRFNELGNSFDNLEKKSQNAGKGIANMLLKLADRAKIMISYQLINLIERALGQVVSTMQTTEDAVVDLQRVLNETISSSVISDELYQIASDFGQTFENVQQVALKFAQTGKSWNEVVDATRATMLGLNTAELEVSTATEGLIAVMAQFKIDASELETVIDKINITADNFPVTSEKIVAALQRAGGTASAFNMTLEETIATITALAAQTGRSGENIGTALNSLIIFTSKTENLELFSNLSDEMDAVVNKFRSGSASVIDVWQQLGKEVADLSAEQERALFDSTAYEEFADTFEAEAAEYAGAIQEIYGTAGAYRRNYLTVLLQDIGEVEKVMANMADAEGYSLTENEKYMNTLTAQWNQLVVAAQELAVQLGQSGILDFIKALTQGSTAVLKFSKSIGGLTTAAGVLLSLFVSIKGQKIGNVISGIGETFKAGAIAIKNFAFSLVGVETSATGAAAATTALGVSIYGVLSILTLAITAIYAVVSAYRQATEAAREYRQEMIEAGKESVEQTKSLADAYKAFQEAKSEESTEKLRQSILELLEVLGYEESDISILIKRYGDLETAINSLVDAKYKQLKVQAEISAQAAHEAIQDVEVQAAVDGINNSVRGWQQAYNVLKEYNDLLGITLDTTVMYGRVPVKTLTFDALNVAPKTIDEAKEKLGQLNFAIELLEKDLTSSELASNEYYQSIVQQAKIYEDLITEVERADDNLEKYNGTLDDFNDLQEYVTNKLDDFVSKFESASSNIINFETELENLSDKFDNLSNSVDSFQGAYSSIIGIIDEYNKTGVMTADMLQTLLEMEPEYISMLNIRKEGLSLNEEAVNELITTNDVYLQQLTAIRIAEETEALAQELQTAATQNKTIAEIESATATALLSSELANAILGEIQGTNSSNEFADALLHVATSAELSGDYLSFFTGKVYDMVNSYTSLLGTIDRNNIRTYYTPKTSGAGNNSTQNAQKEATQKEIDLIKKQKDAVKDYYDTEEEKLKKKKEESDDYYDNLIARLKEVEEANDRINEQADYYANRQKILTNIEQAQARSGVEWRQKEMEYQQELADLDEDWRRKLADWSIDDQVAELERLKEEAQKLIDAQIENLKLLKDAAIQELEDTIQQLQEKLNAISKTTASSVSNGFSSGLGNIGSLFEEEISEVELSSAVALASIRNEFIETASSIKEQFSSSLKEPTESGINAIREWQRTAKESVFDAALSSGTSWREQFKAPVIKGFEDIQNVMRTQMVTAAEFSAEQMKYAYDTKLISPLKRQLQEIMSEVTSSWGDSFISGRTQLFGNSPNNTTNNTNTVNLFANIGDNSTASNTARNVADVLGFNTNPSRH